MLAGACLLPAGVSAISLAQFMETHHFTAMKWQIPTLLVFALAVFSCQALAGHPIVEGVLQGDTFTLLDTAQRLSGTPEGELASALANEDAATAIPTYRRLVEMESFPDELKAVAWQRLYGYAVIVNDNDLANRAARWLNDHPDNANPLFHNGLPPAAQTNYWTVQIGAFGSRTNADRLAADQRSNGYTVQVDPITANRQTLYAVRVGKFNTRDAADSFAQRVFGAGGYRVVEIEY